MLYSSLLFIYGFLPVSLLLYYVTPKKHRPLTMLVLSMIFCGMFSLAFMIFMAVYVLVNYTGCRMIERSISAKCRGTVPLLVCTLFDVFSIFFFRSSLMQPLRESIGTAAAFFPIGISFFTLSAVGTLADIYKRRIPAEKSIIRFALYIVMFPRLIMGPVMRYSSFSRSLDECGGGLSDIGKGFTIFVTGLAKKVIFADALYHLFGAVRNAEVSELSALTAWLGAAAYVLCLYFTLSGFADMATGLGLCFGFRFPKSFSYPLFSTRIRYFYGRWQTQVVKWFRKNMTHPISALSKNRFYRKAVFIAVWGMLGFWYTFDLNGMIWGAAIGIFITLEKHFSNAKMLNFTGVVYTFLAVMLTSVIFLGGDLSYSLRYIFAMIGGNKNLADTLSVYLLKSYIVMLLICMYASTDLFRNVRIRLGKTKYHLVFEAVSPLVILFMLIACTALMSFSGSSGTMLIML